jgi:L,D-transpeptidase catalytic domain
MKSKLALDRYFAILAIAGLALLAPPGSVDPAGAKSRDAKRDEAGRAQGPGVPLLAIVSLSDQRVTIYDAEGKMLQSPVSTGATGLETPAGIFSVVQKKEVHASNIYEDGNMPFMQRITWTGIALHAGVLPGQPASHGCVRMPHAFAQRLFPLTDIGLRVIVVRDDIAPGNIEHPALFKSNPSRRELASATPPPGRSTGSDRAPAIRLGSSSPGDTPPTPGSALHVQILRSIAAAKSGEAEAATKRAADAKAAAARKAAEAGPAVKTLRAAEANLGKAEEVLKGAERAFEAANATPSPPADSPDSAKQENARQESVKQAALAKEKAVARLAETRAQLETAKQQAQAKMDAAVSSGEEAKAADAARDSAVEAAEEASRKTSPVSVFISRKTQRLYIRQGYLPVFEGPVTIRDAEKPIGTFVFTALGYLNNGADVRWSVVSMYKYANGVEPVVQPARRRGEGRDSDAIPADVAAAKAALDRIAIPQDALDRISEVVLPGSSLIISDEGASIETGKDTDFVVLMSGEPQGGLKTRRREPRYRDDDFFGGGAAFGKGGGGGFSFFWN